MARLPCRWCGGSMEHAERAARYCTVECKEEYRVHNAKPTNTVCTNKTKSIDPKFLVRGNISNSSTRSVMDH